MDGIGSSRICISCRLTTAQSIVELFSYQNHSDVKVKSAYEVQGHDFSREYMIQWLLNERRLMGS